MEEILVPLLTFAFVIGSSMIKSFSDKQKEEAKKSSSPQRSIQSQPKQANQPKRERFERFEMDERQFEKQQSQQFDQLRSELNISTRSTITGLDSDQRSGHENLANVLVSANRKRVINKKEIGLNKYFTSKGLVGSVAMSEILGQPRSKRPYHPRNR